MQINPDCSNIFCVECPDFDWVRCDLCLHWNVGLNLGRRPKCGLTDNDRRGNARVCDRFQCHYHPYRTKEIEAWQEFWAPVFDSPIYPL